MSHDTSPQPHPENPQFKLANSLMANYIAALGLAQEMQDRAHLDPLTGIANRYALEQSYSGLQHSGHYRVADAHKPIEADEHSLLMADIDYFKRINDTRGHAQGDLVLKEIAHLMKDTIRERDLVARIGGEEFAVLLPRANSNQAVTVAEKIRKAAEETGDATVSIGVTGLNLGKTLEENMSNADAALYGAKEHGRNTVIQYELLHAAQELGHGQPH